MKKYKSTIYACFIGYITQAIVNNLTPLLYLIFHNQYGLSFQTITLISTINFLIQMGVDTFSAKFVDKIGYRPCVVTAHISCGLGLIGLSILPNLLPSPTVGIFISVLLYAIGGGLIEVVISPIVEACPSENKAGTMSLLHSFYCWGVVAVVLLSTLSLMIFGKESWPFLPVIWAIIPVINAVVFTKVPIPTLVEEEDRMPLRNLIFQKQFIIFFIMMIAAGASEVAMAQWASSFAEDALKVSKTIGDLAGPCAFAFLMGVARVIYAKVSDRIKIRSALMISAVLCIIAYILCVITDSAVISLIGCGLCGFSVGIMWPGVYSLSSEGIPTGGTAMFALLALGGDIGCCSGPTLVGFISASFGDDLKKGILSAIVFPIILLIFSIMVRKSDSAQS